MIVAVLFVSVTLLAGSLLRPSKPNEEKLSTYECGEETIGTTWIRFNVRFYIVALIFVLFDVELVFLFPWATVFGQKKLIEATNGLWGWFALAEMIIFVAILSLGLAYAWIKGHLNWVKPTPEVVNFKSPIPVELYMKVNEKY
jgi:NADH-quinone oxidoreductase subunit A